MIGRDFEYSDFLTQERKKRIFILTEIIYTSLLLLNIFILSVYYGIKFFKKKNKVEAPNKIKLKFKRDKYMWYLLFPFLVSHFYGSLYII